MSNFLPPTTPDLGVLTLLSMISDPEAAKKRLQELVTTTNQLNATVEKSRVEADRLEKTKKAVAEGLTQIEAERKEHQDTVASDKATLEARAKALTDREASASVLLEKAAVKADASSKLEIELNQRQSKLIDRERASSQKEADLSEREQSVLVEEQKHQVRKQKLLEILKD